MMCTKLQRPCGPSEGRLHVNQVLFLVSTPKSQLAWILMAGNRYVLAYLCESLPFRQICQTLKFSPWISNFSVLPRCSLMIHVLFACFKFNLTRAMSGFFRFLWTMSTLPRSWSKWCSGRFVDSLVSSCQSFAHWKERQGLC